MARFLVLFMLFLGPALYAQDAMIKIKDRGDKVYSVFFHADYPYDVIVRLVDGNGRPLNSEKIWSDGFEKPYNLKNLPEGVYTFKVKYSDHKFEHSVAVGEAAQIVLAEARTARKKNKEKEKEKNQERILISESADDLRIALVDEDISALSIFFYLNGSTEDFEYYYWEPVPSKKEQTYDLKKYAGTPVRLEIVEDGKILAEKLLVTN